jgi:hypothetical protein
MNKPKFFRVSIKQDFVNSGNHIKAKVIRAGKKSKDKLKILQNLADSNKKAENNVFTADSVSTNTYVELDEARNINLNPSTSTNKQYTKQVLQNLTAVKKQTSYEHKHDKYAMYALRKMAKAIIDYDIKPKQQIIGKFNNKEILELIECIDEESINQAQQKDLATIKTMAENGNFGLLMPHETTDTMVNRLLSLPLMQNDKQLSKIFNTAKLRQKHFEISRFNNTSFITKFSEIASYENKSIRHASQQTIVENILEQTLNNIGTKDGFQKFLILCNTPAFMHIMLTQPSFKAHIEKLLTAPDVQQQIQEFAKSSILHAIASGSQDSSGDKITDKQIEAYLALLNDSDNNDNQDKTQKYLANGSNEYKKSILKHNIKLAIAQGFIPASMLALFAFSASKMTVLKTLKIIPATIVGVKSSVIILSGQQSGKFTQKIVQFEQDVKSGEAANNTEKSKIVASSLVAPITQGVATGFALAAVKIGTVALIGNVPAAIAFGVVSGLFVLTIPVNIAIKQKEFKLS